MADSVKIQIDLAANPAAAQRLEKAFQNLGTTARKAGHDASRGFDGASARLDAFGQKLGGLKSLFAAAFGVGALAAVYNATKDQERALAQLDAALKSTGNAAGLSRQQYIDLADALMKTSTYSDNAILSAENLLLTFRRIRGNEFVGATKVVLDMATALHVDLNTAAQEVGKALDNPIYGMVQLQRVGITFTVAQKDVIKKLLETGEVAKAQQMILDELSTRYEGSALFATRTFSGAIDQLKHQFGKLLEGSGGNLNDAAASINDLTKTLQDPAIQQGFASVLSGLASLVTMAAKAIAAFGGLGVAIRDALSANSDKSYIGLLAQRQRVADLIAQQKAKPEGFFTGVANDANAFAMPGAAIGDMIISKMGLQPTQTSGIVSKIMFGDTSPDALKKQLADIDARLAKMRADAAKVADGANPKLAPSGKTAPIFGPHAAHAGAGAKSVDQLQTAWAALATQLNTLDAQVAGPGAQAWAKYADTVAKAAQAGGAVIAKGGNVAQVQTLVGEIMQKAAIERDAALKKAADEAGKSQAEVLKWIQQTRAELEGPTAVAVKDYTDKVAALRKLLDAGSITQDIFTVGVETARDKLLKATKATTDQVSEFWKQAARNSQDALAQFLFDPFKNGLRGMVQGVADSIRKIASQMLASNIFKAIGSYGQGQSGWVGAALSMFGGSHAFGNVFNGGALIPHAAGDVIGRPTLFPMSGGRTGLMGEAGPEAIMPLVRASTGHLGVRAVGGGGGALAVRIVNVVDPQATVDAMSSSAGEQVIVNAIKRNATGIRQLLGVH